MFGRPRHDRLFAHFAAHGDVHALGEVFDGVAPELLRIAAHLVGSREQAGDLVQSAFLVAIEKRAEFACHRRVLPWLCGIVANLARNERRRAMRVPATTAPARGEDPAAAAEAAEFRTAFVAAKAMLPELYRPVVELHLDHGLTAEQIGSVLGRPAGTVRTQIVRGLEQLRTRLPKGFVAGFVGVVPSLQSLQAVRALVLQHASGLTPTIPSATAVAGSLAFWWIGVGAMNKKLVVLAAFALVSLGLWLFTGAPPMPGGSTAAHSGQSLRVSSPLAEKDAGAEPANEPVAAREAVPIAKAGAAEPGSLVVTVRWQHDDAPAVDQAIEVVYGDDLVGALHPLRIVTDGQGRAAFGSLRPGAISVWSSTGFRRPATITTGECTQVTLALAGIPILGQVVDARGVPVAGADIWVSSAVRYLPPPHSEAPGHGQHGQFTLRSDAMGGFTTRLAGAQCVAAFHAGHGPSNTVYPVLGTGRSADRPVEVVLRLSAAGGAVAMLVTGPNAEPVPGALVLVGDEVPTLRFGEDHQATTPALRATTDAEGRAVVSLLPAARLPVVVRGAGYGPWCGDVEVPAGGTARLDVRLVAGAVVEGTVFDADGQPLASAMLQHGPANSLRGALASTDARGTYRLQDLPAGDGTVVASHAAWGKVAQKVALVAGETQRWDVRMPPRAVVTGVVIDPQGRPAAGANLLAFAKQGGHASGVADAEGRFTLGPLDPTPTYDLRAEFLVEGALAVVKRSAVAPGSHVELRALTEQLPTARLRGRVLQQDGSPAAGFVLGAKPLDGSPGTEVAIGANGEFALGPWSPDRLRLTVGRSGSHQALADFGVHEMHANRTNDVGDLFLPAFGAARIRILGPEQPGVVALYREGVAMGIREHTTGTVAWQELAPGHYAACVNRGGESPSGGVVEFEVAAHHAAEVELPLVAVVRRELRVVVPKGVVVGSVLVRALDASGRIVMMVEFALPTDGKVMRIGLPTSAVELSGLSANGHRGRVVLDGAPGAGIELSLRPPGR